MTHKLLAIAVVLIGLVVAFRLFVSGAALFLLIAAVLAIAAGMGAIGRTGYLLAAIFLLLGVAGSAMRFAVGAFAMLFRMAPLLLVLVGLYLLARAIRK